MTNKINELLNALKNESYNKNETLEKIKLIQYYYKIALIKKIKSLTIEEKMDMFYQTYEHFLNDYLISFIVGEDFYKEYKNSFKNSSNVKDIINLLNNNAIYIDDESFNCELYDHNIKRIKK